MPKNQFEVTGVQNSYGYIRSYWNNNPDAGTYVMLCTVLTLTLVRIFVFISSSFP